MNTYANSPIINDFIIDVTLIQPINKIVKGLENGNYRDCDIKWLDGKLEAFTRLACQTLGIEFPVAPPAEHFTLLNEYVKLQYVSRFQTLLNYFKTI